MTRQLTSEDEVWQANAWDDVSWDEEMLKEAQDKIKDQIENSCFVDDPDALKKNMLHGSDASIPWNKFYINHNNHFFKDRLWLNDEFPNLFNIPPATTTTTSTDGDDKFRILEIGCGAGNTLFPLARHHSYRIKSNNITSPDIHLYGCDFAQSAIDICKSNPSFNDTLMTVYQYDLQEGEEPTPILPNEEKADIIISIFVLSAISPERLPFVWKRLYNSLKSGGVILFRDYAHYDMTQLRFRPNRLLRPGLYVRGDGTAVHYFTEEELEKLATDQGFIKSYIRTDKRLLVNRFRKLQMYRVWIQSCFYK